MKNMCFLADFPIAPPPPPPPHNKAHLPSLPLKAPICSSSLRHSHTPPPPQLSRLLLPFPHTVLPSFLLPHRHTSHKIYFFHLHLRRQSSHCHRHRLSSHRHSFCSRIHGPQNVGFCRGHRHIRGSCKVCHCRIESFFKARAFRHCYSQSFCKSCTMCPPVEISSPQKQKLRVLCLHGFRTNGSIMETQIKKLDRSVLDLLDMVFLDAPYPAAGKSDVEGYFPPPYYEWFQFERNERGTFYTNLGECIQFITDFMETQGPFDGLVGFSQGAFLSAALAGMQQQGLALTSVPTLRFIIVISGGVLSGEHQWKDCYLKPIQCPSVHLIGQNDFLKSDNEQLVLKFEDALVIRHEARHTVPRLDERAVLPMKTFLEDVASAIREQKDNSTELAFAELEQKDNSTELAFAELEQKDNSTDLTFSALA